MFAFSFLFFGCLTPLVFDDKKICCKLISVIKIRVRVMVFNATFNNISAISWHSVLLVEEIRVCRENHRPAASH